MYIYIYTFAYIYIYMLTAHIYIYMYISTYDGLFYLKPKGNRETPGFEHHLAASNPRVVANARCVSFCVSLGLRLLK